mgnify:FL=1
MSWVRVDDGFPLHPKIMRLWDRPQLYAEAVSLWLAANCWSNKHSTDGLIPAATLPALVPFDPAPAAAALAVECKLWRRTKRGFVFHDFAAYNPTRAQKDERRRDVAARVKRYRNGVTGKIGSVSVTSTPAPPLPSPPQVLDQQQKLPSPSAPAPVASPTSSPLSVTPPPQKKSAGRSKRPEHVADPRHAPFKAHFMARWFAAKGAEFYWTPRDAKDAVRVLALGDNGEIRRRLEIALADPFFLKTGRVGQLADGWNGYANQYATGPPPRPDGGATAMLAEVDAIKRERAAKLSEAAGGRRDSADSAEPGGGAEPVGGRVA